MSILSYLIVGSGYRSQFFGRIARNHPDLFRAMYLCRSEEKAKLVTAATGIPATTQEAQCFHFRPDFVVVAVDRGHNASVGALWASRGYPVMIETPAGTSEEEFLMLQNLAASGARITVCEQYHRTPCLIRGFEAVSGGRIGTPYSAYLSLAHDYHGASLLRRLLMTHGESYVMQGTKLRTPVVPSDSRYGAIYNEPPVEEERDVVSITYASGKFAVYDFSSIQYRTFLRTRHLTVRGERGEWSDNLLCLLDKDGVPYREFLMPYVPEKYRALDTQELRDLRKIWHPELHLDQVQDEFAIGSLLLDMREYIDGGASPYPLEEAIDDARFWLQLRNATSR